MKTKHIIHGTITPMHLADYQRLHLVCESALNDYIVEARNTCRMLGQTGGKRLDIDGRFKLTIQRNLENEALLQLHLARQALFDAVRLGPEPEV